MLQSLLAGAMQTGDGMAVQQLQEAVELGPYGTGVAGAYREHMVATMNR